MRMYKVSNMQSTFISSRGQVMAEYIVVSVFFGLFVWYAIVGGSVDSSGSGGWLETDGEHFNKVDAATANGVIYDKYHPGDTPMPGLIQAIHTKQETFSESIYQP